MDQDLQVITSNQEELMAYVEPELDDMEDMMNLCSTWVTAV